MPPLSPSLVALRRLCHIPNRRPPRRQIRALRVLRVPPRSMPFIAPTDRAPILHAGSPPLVRPRWLPRAVQLVPRTRTTLPDRASPSRPSDIDSQIQTRAAFKPLPPWRPAGNRPHGGYFRPRGTSLGLATPLTDRIDPPASPMLHLSGQYAAHFDTTTPRGFRIPSRWVH